MTKARTVLYASAGLAVMGYASMAMAQAAPAPAAPTDVGEIVVTGSRIARTGFSAPTPTTVIGAQEIERTGATNVADLLNTLPAFRATASSSNSTFRTDGGANYLDLRGLGIVRTLTLVNGQRHVPSNITGQVDLNLIPSILIDRIESVTGGASAAYGSDAVSGVVNLIYKKDVDGLQGEIQGGASQYGDNKEINVGLLYGHAFAGGKGHFTVAGQYVDNKGGDGYDQRDWGRTNYLLFPNPNATATNGQPTRLFVGNVRQSNSTTGGVLNGPGALKGIQFDASGAPVPFIYGNPVGAQNMVGGSGDLLSPYMVLKTPLSRQAVNARVTYEITPQVDAAFEFSVAHAKVDTRGGTGGGVALTIQGDNAFIPASIRTLMAANGVSTLSMGRQNSDISLDPDRPWTWVNVDSKVYRAVASLHGRVGDKWTWDAYYEHGETQHDELQIGNRITANFNRAIDAVVNPATGGIVCRSTLSPDAAVRAAAAGCVPYNVFGYYQRSDDAARYVGGNMTNDIDLSEDVASFSAQGDLFKTWAGPVSLAFGGEYRRDKADSETDAISQAGGFATGNPKPIHGVYQVKEGFVETVVPLARDLPLVQSLEFNGAARIADYNLAGSVTSWKAGLNYVPVDSLRFRLTRSRDVRAPNISELFTSAQSLINTLIDPQQNRTVTLQVISGGNQNLTPETADTTTFGVVFQPSFAPGLRASIDAYDIKIADVISTLNPQDVINRCFAGDARLCAGVTRDGTGAITFVSQQFQNFASMQTQGIDFEALYRLPLSKLSEDWNGALTFRVLSTYVKHLKTSDGVTTVDVAGETGGFRAGSVPHWSGTAVVSYDWDRLNLATQVRYIDSGVLDALGTPQNINVNHVPSRTYVQISGSYTFIDEDKRRLQLFGAVNNLFNTDPPPTAGSTWVQTNQALFDVIGRTYTLGVRFRY